MYQFENAAKQLTPKESQLLTLHLMSVGTVVNVSAQALGNNDAGNRQLFTETDTVKLSTGYQFIDFRVLMGDYTVAYKHNYQHGTLMCIIEDKNGASMGPHLDMLQDTYKVLLDYFADQIEAFRNPKEVVVTEAEETVETV